MTVTVNRRGLRREREAMSTSTRRGPAPVVSAWAALVALVMLTLSACGTVVGAGVGAGVGALAGDVKTGALVGAGAGLIYDIAK